MIKKIILLISSLLIACSIVTQSASAISDMQEAPQTKYKEEKLKKKVEKKKKADEKKNTQYKVQMQQQGGVDLKATKYPYKQYRPVSYIDGGWNPVSSENLMKSVNLIADLVFKGNLFVSENVDYFLSSWFDVQIIEKLVNPISELSKSIFDPMKDNLIPFIFTIGLFFATVYFAMGRVGQTMGVIFKGAFIFGLALVWFSSQVYFINTANSISEDGQSLFMSANEPLSDKPMQENNEKQSTIAHIRNYYFETTVEKPYLLMNYGTVSKSAIDEKKKNRVDELLTLKQNKQGNKKREQIAKKEVNDLKNSHMNSDSPGDKIVMGVTTIILNILISIPLLAVALFDMFLQVMIPLTMLFLPIVFALSMLPQLTMSIGKSFANLGMLFFMKMLVGILVTLTFTIINISEMIVPIKSMGSYISNLLITILIYFLVYKFRNQLISIVSGGAIQTKQRGRPGANLQKFNPQNMLKQKQEERLKKQSTKQQEISNINRELRQSEQTGVGQPGRNQASSQEQVAKSTNDSEIKSKDQDKKGKNGIKQLFSKKGTDDTGTPKANTNTSDTVTPKSDNNIEDIKKNGQIPSNIKSQQEKPKANVTGGTTKGVTQKPNKSNVGSKTGGNSNNKPRKELNQKELNGLQKDVLGTNRKINEVEKQFGSNPEFNKAKKDYAEYKKKYHNQDRNRHISTTNKSPYYKAGIDQSRRMERQRKNLETLVSNKSKVLSEHKSYKSDSKKDTRVNRGKAYRDYIEKGTS